MSLEMTGERFIPGMGEGIELEHMHRYIVARELAKNKEVLDIASGEGYGSRILANNAKNVIGVDISQDAVDYANKKYSTDNLKYLQGNAALIPLPDASVDMVVSFETIEHHDKHEEMMREIKRVLRQNGLLCISSPEKYAYSDITEYSNEYHVKELYRAEFTDLLDKNFKRHVMLGQRVSYGSVIAAENVSGLFWGWHSNAVENEPSKGLCLPLYLIALASDGALPEVVSSILDDDAYLSQLEGTKLAVADYQIEIDRISNDCKCEIDRLSNIIHNLTDNFLASKEEVTVANLMINRMNNEKEEILNRMRALPTWKKYIKLVAENGLKHTMDVMLCKKGKPSWF